MKAFPPYLIITFMVHRFQSEAVISSQMDFLLGVKDDILTVTAAISKAEEQTVWHPAATDAHSPGPVKYIDEVWLGWR